jgi:uncharacterized membrane protein YsdA (DUF1294 family)
MVIIAFTLNSFIPTIPVIIWYLVSINIFTFFVFTIDKYNSTKERKRVPELSLHFFSFAGGIFGAFISMLVTKHKIRKKLFLAIQTTILILWVFSIYYVITNLEVIQKALN